MKKQKNEKKPLLNLDTETLRVLQSEDLENVVGGMENQAAAGWSISISWGGGKPCCECN